MRNLGARALVDRLWDSEKAVDIVRLQAEARLIAASKESKWPRRRPSIAELIRHLMDQPTRGHSGRNDSAARYAEPRQRGASRQEGTEPSNGAAVARALRRAGRRSHSSAETRAAHR